MKLRTIAIYWISIFLFTWLCLALSRTEEYKSMDPLRHADGWQIQWQFNEDD